MSKFFLIFLTERTKRPKKLNQKETAKIDAKKKQRRRKNRISAEKQTRQGLNVGLEMLKVIKNHFSQLFNELNEKITDPRTRREYSMTEIVMAAIFMFAFKEKSRNAFNNELKQETFLANYNRLLGLRIPHMDTVEKVMREIDSEELEKVKTSMIKSLLQKKVLPKFKVLGGAHLVVVDGTGVHSYDYKHCEHCLSKNSSNGVTTYFHNVLEAKIVTPTGLVVPLASEWIANDPDNPYDKQDCELKAFKRLAHKLKEAFPKLPIVIGVDALYPNYPFMQICRDNNWHFIATLKDNLRCLQDEIKLQVSRKWHHSKSRSVKGNTQHYCWINHLFHEDITLHWLNCQLPAGLGKKENKDKNKNKKCGEQFTYITDMLISADTVADLCAVGRTRWKIENEGFNTQKNGGYGLSHKYSRNSFTATKNYYCCLQIAHLINQFVERSVAVVRLTKEHKFTIQHVWEKILRPAFALFSLHEEDLEAINSKVSQIRLYT